jgi:hypothetical protein
VRPAIKVHAAECSKDLQLDQVDCQANLGWDRSAQVTSTDDPATAPTQPSTHIHTHCCPFFLTRSQNAQGGFSQHNNDAWRMLHHSICTSADGEHCMPEVGAQWLTHKLFPCCTQTCKAQATHRRCSSGWKSPEGMVPATPGRSNMYKSVSEVKSERKSGNWPSRLGIALMFLLVARSTPC